MSIKNKKIIMSALVLLTIALIISAEMSQDKYYCSGSRYIKENLIEKVKFGLTKAQVLQALDESNIDYSEDYINSREDETIIIIKNNSLHSEYGSVNRVGFTFVDGRLNLYFFMFAFGTRSAALQHLSFLNETFGTKYGRPIPTFPPAALTAWEPHQGSQLATAFEQSKTQSTAASAYTLMCRIKSPD